MLQACSGVEQGCFIGSAGSPIALKRLIRGNHSNLRFVDQGGQQSENFQLGCKSLELCYICIGLVEVCGKGLLFSLGQLDRVAQLRKATLDMVQSVWDIEFVIFPLYRVGGIVDMGPGQVLCLNSFS